ncbi:MAG: hypothetical protein ACP5XB_18860, partial [Isosphaeraceae bacterium]
MTACRTPFPSTLLQAAVFGLSLLFFAGSATAQLPYQATPYYNWGAGDPYGLNYNADYMRYGLPGVGVSPWNPIVQAQLSLGMEAARYEAYNAWTARMYQAANLYNQQAITQQLANERQMQQAMEPRYDVRQRTPRPPRTREPAGATPLPRNQVLSPEGSVLWPGRAPADAELGKSRAAAEAAIKIAVKEYTANGRATVQSIVEAKERLAAYGKPALQKLADANMEAARNLLRFLTS